MILLKTSFVSYSYRSSMRQVLPFCHANPLHQHRWSWSNLTMHLQSCACHQIILILLMMMCRGSLTISYAMSKFTHTFKPTCTCISWYTIHFSFTIYSSLLHRFCNMIVFCCLKIKTHFHPFPPPAASRFLTAVLCEC